MGAIQRIAADRLDGSEITTVPPHQVGLSEALLAENTDPRDLQGAATRNGRELFVSGAILGSNNGVHGVKAWSRDLGTSYLMVRSVNQDWIFNGSTASQIFASITGTTNAFFKAEPLDNKLVIAVDGTVPRKYEGGTTFSSLGGSPPSAAKYVAQFASKVWLGGDSSNPQTKSFSATNDPEDWTAADDAGSITTQDGGGDTMRGLAANNKVLLTFYRNHVDMLSGESTFNFREERLINRGLVSETGYVASGEVVFFASDDAIYMVAGSTISDITSARMRKTYIDISDKSMISLSVQGDMLFVDDYGADRTYVCAFKYGRWSEWSGQPFSSFDTAIDQTLFAGTDTGSTTQVYKLNVGSLDGAATITASWRPGNFGFGWNDAVKNLRAIRLHGKPGLGTTTITFYRNGSALATTATLTFATSSTGQHDWAGLAGPALCRGHFIGFKASWAGPGTLYGWAMYAEITVEDGAIPQVD